MSHDPLTPPPPIGSTILGQAWAFYNIDYPKVPWITRGLSIEFSKILTEISYADYL